MKVYIEEKVKNISIIIRKEKSIIERFFIYFISWNRLLLRTKNFATFEKILMKYFLVLKIFFNIL